ncbi:MAG: hypothetical protein O2958_10515 [Gemmatimonadetes bacterium]|nr:hypothetical protein [Gemmatimonadota bacterium]MDA1103454.1 hypothetical protein [Gemmatimonadota bacterium]
MEPERDAPEGRVHRLERTNRFLIVLIGAFGLLPVLTGARQDQVDEAGQVRMDLRHDSTKTGMFILDGAGDTRLGAAQFSHGGGGYALLDHFFAMEVTWR